MLTIALILDALLGEPAWVWRRVPHPAVLMGRTIAAFEGRLNKGSNRKVKGLVTMSILILALGLLGAALSLLGPIVEILLAAVLLAQRSLTQHVSAVATGLRMGLPEGRRTVAMIVSRDTAAMTEPEIARSAIESGAENLSDGVIAPALWFLVAGLPGLFIYKIVNTADSMIGYRTPRYNDFGWAAARIDDLLNWIPARITAVLIALPAGVLGQSRDIATDAALHKSPNAGWPEAAMARAINVALAGPRAYNGEMQQFAWVNAAGTHDIGPTHIDAAVTRLWQAWGVMLGATLILGLLF